MTQHLTVQRHNLRDDFYLTACGRWVISANATGPAGVTCRACKNTDAWDKALYGVERGAT